MGTPLTRFSQNKTGCVHVLTPLEKLIVDYDKCGSLLADLAENDTKAARHIVSKSGYSSALRICGTAELRNPSRGSAQAFVVHHSYSRPALLPFWQALRRENSWLSILPDIILTIRCVLHHSCSASLVTVDILLSDEFP
jgi:hypothetical protein